MALCDSTVIEPDGDFNRLLTVLHRQGEPDRVPFYELFSNIEAQVMGRQEGQGRAVMHVDESHIQLHIEHQRRMGYDYVGWRTETFRFLRPERAAGQTPQGERHYVRGSDSLISSWQQFEAYPWPDMNAVDYSGLDEVANMLPERMKLIPAYSGIFENTVWIVGYENMCTLLFEDRALLRACFDAVGARIAQYFSECVKHPAVGAIVMGDDMGFKTQTMIAPADIREFVLPWHETICQTAHAAGKATILHSCGNLTEIMDDLIACGWDAKHSFEDQIQPVWEAKELYGDRIALLGGFDMDKLARFNPRQVRDYTRWLISKCGRGGGWALGSGNSVADYVPAENFVAMLDEGYRFGRYPLSG